MNNAVRNKPAISWDLANNLVEREFIRMGYEIIACVKSETHPGPDMHIQNCNTVLRVEIKRARKRGNSSQIAPIEKNRLSDDFIAVVFNSGYVFIEQMSSHLKLVGVQGSRTFPNIF